MRITVVFLAFQKEIRERFTREAQTAARLSHPHIVPIHDVGNGSGLVYFIMGLVEGESLGSRLKRRGRLTDYAAFRDDAAEPRLTVPNTKLI